MVGESGRRAPEHLRPDIESFQLEQIETRLDESVGIGVGIGVERL